MTITFVSSQEYTFSSSSGQLAHTINVPTGSRTHGILLVKANVDVGAEITGVTWNGNAMAERVESGNASPYTEIWSLVEFGGGTADVVVSFPDTTTQRIHIVVEWYDSTNAIDAVPTDTDIANATTEDPVTLTVTTVAGDLVVSSYSTDDNVLATVVNQTLTQEVDHGNDCAGAGYLIADGTSEAVGWDRGAAGQSSQFAMVVAVFHEGSGGGGGTDALDADPITTGAPTLGTPTIAQTHALTSTAVVTGSPVLGAPALGQTHALDADPVTTGSPVLGTPTIGQAYALAPLGITTGSPSVGSPSLGQTHSLGLDGDVTGAPSLGTPSLGQTHALDAVGITTGSPTLGTPSLSEGGGGTDALDAVGITTGAPSLGSPTIAQVHALDAVGITTGSPALGSPTLGQTHALSPGSLLTAPPVLGEPVLGQIHALDAGDIVTGSPVLGTPSIAALSALVALGILAGVPDLGSPALGQVHALVADDILAGVPVLGTPDRLDSIAPAGRRSIIAGEGRGSGPGGTARVTRPKADNRSQGG